MIPRPPQVEPREDDPRSMNESILRLSEFDLSFSIRHVNDENHQMTPEEDVILATAGGLLGSITITLPRAAEAYPKFYMVKRLSSGGILSRVFVTSQDQIDGATTHTLGALFDGVVVVSDGTTWWIMAETP